MVVKVPDVVVKEPELKSIGVTQGELVQLVRKRPSRRAFLFKLGAALNVVAASLMGIPVIGFVLSSFRHSSARCARQSRRRAYSRTAAHQSTVRSFSACDPPTKATTAQTASEGYRPSPEVDPAQLCTGTHTIRAAVAPRHVSRLRKMPRRDKGT